MQQVEAHQLSPSEYESLVTEITEAIRASAPELRSYSLGYGRENRVEGASGYAHQIDVSLTKQDFIYLVECKRWKRRIGPQAILVLAGRVMDIAKRTGSQAKGIIVSQDRATIGARQLAGRFNIDIEIVKSSTEFGIRIGKQILVGLQSIGHATTEVTATLTRGGNLIP